MLAQQAPVWRVAILTPTFDTTPPLFRQELNNLGYIDGKNLIIDVRRAEGDFERLPALAQELVALRPDVIIAVAGAGAIAAAQASSGIPIVMSPATDPIGLGLVKSFAHPGGLTDVLSSLRHDPEASHPFV